MRLRQLLDVVEPRRRRIVVDLAGADLPHVQDDLRVFGVVLVPAAVYRLACTRERDRRDEAKIDARFDEPIARGRR